MQDELFMKSPGRDVAKLALRFVLIVGIVNFFADMTYEGGRAIVGPFLGSLGASAAFSGATEVIATSSPSC